MKRLVLLIFCFVLIVGVFSGCGNDYSSAYIYFELDSAPLSLDPQTASTDSELIIVRNLYEGLLRKSESGAVVCGASESFEENRLKYTFKLNKNSVWSDGTPVTARDFAFGIQRAISPHTKSPFASGLFSIVNARAINKGKADMSSLGVKVIDDYTLSVELSFNDPNFKSALTSSAAMPCNEEFFNKSSGKYGRDYENTLSNGSYLLGKWNKDEFGIRLYENEDYNGEFKPSNAAVFLSCRKDEDVIELLGKNSVDITFLDNNRISETAQRGFKTYSINNTCWVLTLGGDLNENIKKALCMAVSDEVYSKSLSEGFKTADSLYPDVINTGDKVKNTLPKVYDLEYAKQLLSDEISKRDEKKFPETTLYYYDDAAFKPCVNAIVGHWQQKLSAFINIKANDNLENISSQLNKKSLPLAIFPVTAKGVSAAEYLLKFGVDFYDSGLDFSDEGLISAQNTITAKNTLIPIAYENTNIVCTNYIKDIYVDKSNGYIDFSFVIKQD